MTAEAVADTVEKTTRNLRVPSGKGVVAGLSALFSSAATALVTTIAVATDYNPLALALIAVVIILLALLGIIGYTFIQGDWIHRRELDNYKLSSEETINMYKQRHDKLEARLWEQQDMVVESQRLLRKAREELNAGGS